MCQPAVRVMRSKFSTDAWHTPAHYRIPAATAAAAPRPGPGQPRRQQTPFACERTHIRRRVGRRPGDARRGEAYAGVRKLFVRCMRIMEFAKLLVRFVLRLPHCSGAVFVCECVCVSERERERSLAGEDGFTRRATGVWNGIVSERGSSFL